MADLDLDALRRLAEEATGAPWEFINAKPDGAPEWMSVQKFIRAPNVLVKNDRGPDYATEIMSDEDYDTKDADGALIVAAVNALPELLSRAERLAKAERALREIAAMDKHSGASLRERAASRHARAYFEEAQ